MPYAPDTFKPDGPTRQVRERWRKAELDKRRGSSTARGYNDRWRKYRLKYLAEHPLCVACLPDGITPATVVDHITPHRGDHRLFWKPENHQALCKPCHDRKTARETLNQISTTIRP